jgi:glycosyltransferase involved in cell wall biosynthesis
MNIVIDARTTQDEVKYNGIGRYARIIIEQLVRNNPEENFSLILYSIESTLDAFLETKPQNVNVINIGEYNQTGILNMIRHNFDLFFHIRLNKALKNVDRKNSIFFSPYFWRGLPVFKLPTVAVFHDFALVKYNIYSTISFFHNIIRFFHYWSEIFKMHFAKHIIVDSQYTYEDIFKYLPLMKKDKVSKVLLGVYQEESTTNFELYLPTDWRKREYLLYLGGGLTKNKNSEGVIDSYVEFIKILKEKGFNEDQIPYLVIAGKIFKKEHGNSAKLFSKYFTDKGIEKFVHLTGEYDDNSRWGLLHNCFAYIHLSLFEGFGFGVAEALRAKVPVIAHNGSTYPEVVGEGGILVDGTNALQTAQAIYKLYSDREFGKVIAQKGYEQSLKFDWNITQQNTIKILKETFNGNTK